VSILSRLSLEVKEISAKVGRFGTRLLQSLWGVQGHCPHSKLAKRPTFNTVIFGAVIARAGANGELVTSTPYNRVEHSRGVYRLCAPAFFLSASFTWLLSTGAMGRFGTRLHINLWGIPGQRQRPNRRNALYLMPSLLARLLRFTGTQQWESQLFHSVMFHSDKIGLCSRGKISAPAPAFLCA